jgi:hypothetical protein
VIQIHNNNPFVTYVLGALFVVGLVVYPFLKTVPFRLTAAKIIAVLIAMGIAIYSGTFAISLILLWPLSFIWFPEYWGNYTGSFQGRYIREKSPPILIALMGWFFLVAFPALFFWITNQ